MKGVGLTSGLDYKFAGFTQGPFVGGESFPMVDHYENRFIVIGPGAGNNSLFFDTYKTVINAPGDYVVRVEKHRVECR